MPPETDAATRLLFSEADRDARRLYVMTPGGVIHLTPTELAILVLIQSHEGESLSKARIATILRRNQRVIGRLVSHLRRQGVLESIPTYGEDGGQLANEWRIAEGVRPLGPDEDIPAE